MENKIIIDESAIKEILEILGFKIENSFIFKNGKPILINNKKIKLAEVGAIQNGQIYKKNSIELLALKLL